MQKVRNDYKTKYGITSLGFIQNDKVYTKTIGDITIGVDCVKQEIIYPEQITIHDKTTSNFSHPENFVVFECVHRLLQKDYKPEHLELEPRWNLGRDAKGGKADILVRDHQGSPYLLIECKTTDSKNSEFAKEWAKMLENGGQLFSYFQQERGVKYLCLYTSDFNQSLLTYENYIISVIDNDATLTQQSDDKQKAIGYKDAHNNEELFKVWKETYSNDYATNGIFENEIQAYKITQLKPTFESLKSIDYSSMQRKKHQWATILRYSGVGDRGVALNRIMNLLLCKITDEAENKKDLQFSWGGFSADSAFSLVDRLQYLYQKGMQKYLNINIIYTPYDKNTQNRRQFVKKKNILTQKKDTIYL
ncbi:type I restriction enzyme HsdR N-terminal domain-containing protein [Helicobacter sp. 14348-15]|uniref:type I restriction enzyme HsdR N-terminal domain-containing protein n=1 Tax=Helicobacter colisuis TaxID=2949739 RepID=UPI00202B4CC5|nr:type I restriction enzyme HsdR N-terminal domain-containing protein [Helicobacter colisuis]MCL9820139.1 type I restriction enzyme HsdR N-terminal domain-containing protein [Helicobacter colisuis]